MLTYVEEKADDSHDVLLVEVVEDLGGVLDDVEGEVAEGGHRELVRRENPEDGASVVGNSVVYAALVDEKITEDVEATLVGELLGQLVGLEQVHEAVRVAVHRQVIPRVKEVREELLSVLRAVLVFKCLDEDSQNVGSQVS